MIKEAVLYEPLADSRVRCTACARYCNIPEGKIGLCGIRQNIGGKLHLLVYGKIITGHIDPIEKKPVTHYMPGTKIFSIATTGCNWLCHPAGTSILLADGSSKKIENIVPGDLIWSYDTKNGLGIVPNAVTHSGSRRAQVYDVDYGSSGRTLVLTGEHPVYTRGGWKEAKDLVSGDLILKAWNQNAKIWKQSRASTIAQAKFHCRRCGSEIMGLDDWNRHRGKCYTEGLKSEEELESIRQRMRKNNPMKDPLIKRRMLETQKRDFLTDPNHGWRRNTVRIRRWLHQHPSTTQKQLYSLLDDLGAGYRKEYRIIPERRQNGSRSVYLADAAVPSGKLDIEVDGWWHYNSDQVLRSDRIRDRTLALNGWKVLRLSGREVRDHPEEVKALIADYLSQPSRSNKRIWLPVKRVTPTQRFETVYSFECLPNHTYLADGVLVHNCHYCQNFDISQRRKVEGIDVTDEEVVRQAKSYGCQGIAYTYNQPTIFLEFAHDVGVIARREGLINIFVSNGYDTPDSVTMMERFLDCITVDFKGNAETSFLRKYVGVADAEPIYQTIQEIRDRTKIHVEITDLVIPQIGDNLQEARKLSKWVFDNLGPDTPMHFLQFHPDYKLMHLPRTPIETLERHHQVAKDAGLRYVYLGNVPGHPLENTYCPECGQIAVRRYGFDIVAWNLDENNRCSYCGYPIPIVGSLANGAMEERFIPVIN